MDLTSFNKYKELDSEVKKNFTGNLTEYNHDIPDKHNIGDTLPAPDVVPIAVGTAVATVGTSPVAAREDHVHGEDLSRDNWEAGKFSAILRGTEALPAYTFSSDPDTGMFSPAVNGVSLVAGGDNRFKINSANTESFEDTPILSKNKAGTSVGEIVAYDSGKTQLDTTRALTTSLAYLASSYVYIAPKGRAYKLHVQATADIGHTGGVSTNVVELWRKFGAGAWTLAATNKMITGAAAGYRINAHQGYILDVAANTSCELRLYGVRIGGTSSSVYSVHTGYTWWIQG